MPAHVERKVSVYTPEQLFDLVLDVERYPEFLPWCLGAEVTERRERSFDATLSVGFQALRTSYGSRVDHERPGRIDVTLLHGPFRHLSNRWLFQALEEGGTEIRFEIDFEFRSSLFSRMLTPLFGGVVQCMVREFEQRARAQYSAAPESPVSA